MTDLFFLQRGTLYLSCFSRSVLGQHFIASGSIHWWRRLSWPSTSDSLLGFLLFLSLSQKLNQVVTAASKPVSHAWGPNFSW